MPVRSRRAAQGPKEAPDGLERERSCRLLGQAGAPVRPERGSRRSHSLRGDGRQVRVSVVREAALHAVVAGMDGSTAGAAPAVAPAERAPAPLAAGREQWDGGAGCTGPIDP